MSLEIVSPSTQGAVNFKSTPLSQVLLFPDFFSLFGDNCSFLDLYLFAKALEKSQPLLASSFLARLDFRQLIDRPLSALGIVPGPFWKAIKDSEAVLHGSFLLSCLLDPINGKQNKIFTEESDIDILEPTSQKKEEICPSCLRKLHGVLFPNKTCSMKIVEMDLLGVKKDDKMMKKKQYLHAMLRNNNIEPKLMPHIHQRDATVNPLGKYLCHQGQLCGSPKFNYSALFEAHFVWMPLGAVTQESRKVAIDQCTIAVKNKKELLEWIPRHVDFAFGKVVYDGEKLTIFDLPALLSKSSPFPEIDLGKTDPFFSPSGQKREKYIKILQFWKRTLSYEKKGFKVFLSNRQTMEVEEALEYRERKKQMGCFFD